MLTRKELNQYLREFLEIDRFQDYCPNGLQVEGKSEIQTIVTGVTACEALIDKAIEQQADAILVHHGYFWKGESEAITGMKGRRIKKLLQHDINLFAYHLPLDAHPTVGNNVQLAKVLGFEEVTSGSSGNELVFSGKLPKSLSAEALGDLLEQKLGRTPLVVTADKPIKTIAWCTGGAQGYIDAAIELGVDAYLTGEASEQTFHMAIENNIHFFAAGHHATERYGIKALGEAVSHAFGITHHFIDIDNPI